MIDLEERFSGEQHLNKCVDQRDQVLSAKAEVALESFNIHNKVRDLAFIWQY